MIRSPLGRLVIAGAAGLLAVGVLAAPASAATNGTIQGTFSTGAGTPVVAAAVHIFSTDFMTDLYVDTDAAGAFHAQVPPGDYHVSYSWDAAVQWSHQAFDEDSADTITVTAGQTTEVDDHKLPTGTVGGHLTAADGSPLASASVTLHHGYDALGWATTDENGDYSFGEALARDGYTVSFSTIGGPEQWVPGAVEQSKARTFAVAPGAAAAVDDTQVATGSLRGRLIGTDGYPEPRFPVNAVLDGTDVGISRSTVTDSDGNWHLDGLFPGNYRVSFSTQDNRRTQWAYGAGSAAAAKLFAVGAGAPVVVDDTWLDPARLVVKTVDATTGAPVSNFCVWLDTPNDASDCASGSQVLLDELPGGTFHLSVTPDSSGYYLQSPDIPVTLTSGQTTTVTVPLTLGGKVAFTAADHATGAPVAGTCGILKMIGNGGLGDGYGDCTDGTGKGVTYNPKAAGTYELFAVAPGGYGDQWVGDHGGTGDQQTAARIVVRPGTTVTAPAALLDPAGTITGVVTGSDGKPPAYGYVAFSAWDDSGPGWDTGLDANGRYTLGKLGPYSWPLLFGSDGDPRQWSGHTGNRFQAAGVPVTAGGTTTYDFSMSKGSTLKGKVTVPSAPTAAWRLRVVNAATGDFMGEFDSSAAGPHGAYAVPLLGGTSVKIGWAYFPAPSAPDVDGWYKGADSQDTATKVGIPAHGSKRVNLKLR